MPIYEYKCHNCGHLFEELQSMNADPAKTKCPKCGALRSERILSAFSSSGSSGSAVSAGGSNCGSGAFT